MKTIGYHLQALIQSQASQKGRLEILITGFVQVLENLESHGILFFSFPGLESHGILRRVMESHGKLYHYKNYESFFIVYHDGQKFH